VRNLLLNLGGYFLYIRSNIACFQRIIYEIIFHFLSERTNSHKHTYSKGKVHSKTGHEGLEEVQMYSSILSLTSAIYVVGGERYVPAVYPRKKPDTHSIGGWVGPRAGLDGC
jgi:hypothetical protein